MAKQRLAEGETRVTDLPCPGEAVMNERMVLGVHYLDIEKKGKLASSVRVKDYPHWQSAFDAAMDKAGL